MVSLPFPEGENPVIQIDRKLNALYDHGEETGGNLIDFGIRYLKCSVSDLLDKLSIQPASTFSFQLQVGPQPTPTLRSFSLVFGLVRPF